MGGESKRAHMYVLMITSEARCCLENMDISVSKHCTAQRLLNGKFLTSTLKQISIKMFSAIYWECIRTTAIENPTLVLRHAQIRVASCYRLPRKAATPFGFRPRRGGRARLPECRDVSAGNEWAAGQEGRASVNAY